MTCRKYFNLKLEEYLSSKEDGEIYIDLSRKLTKLIEEIIYKKHRDQKFTKIVTGYNVLLFLLIDLPNFRKNQSKTEYKNSIKKIGYFDDLTIYMDPNTKQNEMIISREPSDRRDSLIDCILDKNINYLESVVLVLKDIK